ISFADFDVSESAGQLAEGANVLAFHALNRGTGSSDMLFRVELHADIAVPGPPLPPGYFSTPTPGERNPGAAGLVIPQSVTFSKASGTFVENFNLALGGAIAGQRIRYTTDGSVPGVDSPIYSGPVAVASSSLVRARVEEIATGTLGFVASAKYEKLAGSISNYNAGGEVFRS